MTNAPTLRTPRGPRAARPIGQAASWVAPTPLPRAWYERDALVVARALIGCLLVHEQHEPGRAPLVARIVETEAYRGPKDLACHARAGLTRRTRSLLGEEGHAYVYFVYGMHECFNVTCHGAGAGHAVLVRAAEPVAGFGAFPEGARLDGPGRLTRGLGITRALDGHDLTTGPLYLAARTGRPRLVVTPRVGVAYSGEWADRPWRFLDAKSAHVSRPPKSAIGRGLPRAAPEPGPRAGPSGSSPGTPRRGR